MISTVYRFIYRNSQSMLDKHRERDFWRTQWVDVVSERDSYRSDAYELGDMVFEQRREIDSLNGIINNLREELTATRRELRR